MGLESASFSVESTSLGVESALLGLERASLSVESALLDLEIVSFDLESTTLGVESASLPLNLLFLFVRNRWGTLLQKSLSITSFKTFVFLFLHPKLIFLSCFTETTEKYNDGSQNTIMP